MRTHHEGIFSEVQAADTNEASQVSGNKKSGRTQQTLDGFIQNVTPFAINHPMSRKITRYVTEMIALDNQPFFIVEDEGFKRLVEVLIIPPSNTTTYMTSFFPSHYTRIEFTANFID